MPLSDKALEGKFFMDVLTIECSTNAVNFVEIGELFVRRDIDPVDTPIHNALVVQTRREAPWREKQNSAYSKWLPVFL
jgi:hypothetical protein